jgi:hypothetical protein
MSSNHINLGLLARNALSLAACALGLVTAAQPSQTWYNGQASNPGEVDLTEAVDIDFSKSSTAFPARNFPTWNSPAGSGVKYFAFGLFKDNTTGCYEVSSFGTASDDVTISYQNTAGTWMLLSDDDGGSRQFRARYAVIAHEDHFLRISPYSTTYTNAGIVFNIKKIKADPFNTNTSDPNSCRVANIPYYRRAFNNDLPYLAP